MSSHIDLIPDDDSVEENAVIIYLL